MVYTLTLNPAIDYIVNVDNYKQGEVNRTSGEKLLAGGKGINVSTVLKNLGSDTKALGFLAGFTGEIIRKMLDEDKIKNDFIFLENGYSRINVKLKTDEETEINGQGPEISEKFLNELYKKLAYIKSGDALVLAGSIPKSISSDIYCEILEKLSDKSILTVVDATGELLKKSLKYNPFLIKPNRSELEELCGHKLETLDDISDAARELKKAGAKNVLVSLGADGALLVTEDNQVICRKAVKGNVINSTGAGDSMVAGFIYGWLEKDDYSYALDMGISAGSASTFSENLATKEEIEKIYELLQ